jgi:hypothetical protein
MQKIINPEMIVREPSTFKVRELGSSAELFCGLALPEGAVLTQLLCQPPRNDRLVIGPNCGLRENSPERISGFGGVWVLRLDIRSLCVRICGAQDDKLLKSAQGHNFVSK